MLMRPTPLALSLALLSLPVLAEHTIEVSVPTGGESAFSVTPARALEALQKTPGGVAVVEAKTFTNGRAGTLEDSLRLAPGVFAVSRFGSDEARVSIRGSGLQRTFHGRGLMLLQDGVPLTLADGSFDMQAVEPLATRYIEVERGANALRYGAGTLGGAINYISQTGRSSPPLVLRAEGGSYGYQRLQVAAGGQRGDLDGFASLSALQQEGFRDHARQQNLRLFSNVGVQLGDGVETRFYFTAVDTDSELPGNLTFAQLRDNPRQANTANVTRDQKRDFRLYRLANRTQIRHDDASTTEITSFFATKDLFHPIFALIAQDNRDGGIGLRHERHTHWLGMAQDHVAGIQWRRGLTLDERFMYQGASGHARGALDHRQKQTANQVDAYAQSSWHWTSRFTTVAGVQHTSATRSQVVLQDAFAPSPTYSQRYDRLTPRMGIIYRINPDVQLYGNLSGSFEPPSFSETLNNAPLRAQRAMTTELGLRGDAQQGAVRLAWDAAYYRARVQNELLQITLDGANRPGTTNAGNTLHQGVELALAADSTDWRARASYLFNDFRFREGPFKGNDIAGLPRQVLTAEAALRVATKTWVGPTLRAASRAFVDHANTLAAPGYAAWGLKLQHQLDAGLDLFVEARNLADKRYAATTDVVMNANGQDAARFLPGEGRALYTGITKVF